MESTRNRTHSGYAWGKSVLGRTLLFAGFWHVLNQGDWSSWFIGLPAVWTAVWVSYHLRSRVVWRLRWRHLPGFLFYFIRSSLAGAWDVTRRVLDPRLPICRVSPGI